MVSNLFSGLSESISRIFYFEYFSPRWLQASIAFGEISMEQTSISFVL
jgi:hypothetical protein